jgi:hypothetical protein
MCIVIDHWNNSTRVEMLLHSDTVYWFRDQSLLFLLNVVCLAEKQQPDQGEKLVPNTFIMFGDIFIYRIKSCSYSIKSIVSKLNGKFDRVITWPFNISVSSFIMFVILHFWQIIHCKLSIMMIVGTKRHKYLHGIHV